MKRIISSAAMLMLSNLLRVAVLEAQDTACGEIGLACCQGAARCPGGVACSGDVCTLPSLASLPIMTMDLRIAGCSNSDAVLRARNLVLTRTLRASWSPDPNAPKSEFLIHVPDEVMLDGGTMKVGVRLPGISRLGQIMGLELEISAFDCVTRLDLVINDHTVGSFRTGMAAPSVDPERIDEILATFDPLSPSSDFPPNVLLTVDRAALEASAAGRNVQELCALPRGISGEAILRQVTAALGSYIVAFTQSIPEEGGIAVPTRQGWFGPDDFVSASKSGDSSIEVLTQFHTAGALVTLRFQLAIECEMVQVAEGMPLPQESERSALSFELSPIEVAAIDVTSGDPIEEIAVDLGIAQSYVEEQINKNLEDMRASLRDIFNLPACPGLSFEGSLGERTPALEVGVDVALLFAADRFDDNMCQ